MISFLWSIATSSIHRLFVSILDALRVILTPYGTALMSFFLGVGFTTFIDPFFTFLIHLVDLIFSFIYDFAGSIVISVPDANGGRAAKPISDVMLDFWSQSGWAFSFFNRFVAIDYVWSLVVVFAVLDFAFWSVLAVLNFLFSIIWGLVRLISTGAFSVFGGVKD